MSEGGLGEGELVQDSISLAYQALNAEDVLVELLPAGLTVCQKHPLPLSNGTKSIA